MVYTGHVWLEQITVFGCVPNFYPDNYKIRAVAGSAKQLKCGHYKKFDGVVFGGMPSFRWVYRILLHLLALRIVMHLLRVDVGEVSIKCGSVFLSCINSRPNVSTEWGGLHP